MDGNAINRAAEFFPIKGEGELPALRVGGLLVTAYVAKGGHFAVAVDSSDVEEGGLMHDGGVPNLRIVLNEARVYDDSQASRDAGTAFTLGVTDIRPEPDQQRRLSDLTDEIGWR